MDAVTGQQVWYWNPDAFGVGKPSDSTTGLPNGVVINLRFPGQYYDQQSGLYYNHNRYYNPELGRYMEPDPIGLEGGLNPYAYAGNNPVMNTDPSGLASVGQILDDSAMRAASLNNTLQLAALSFAKVTWDVFGAENISRWADGQITSRIGLGIETAAAIPFVGPIAKLSKVASVSKYEVGTFDVLKGRSIVGDGLDIHHAMQKNPAGQVVPNYNPLSAPSIALPRAEHAMIPTLRGPYTGSARSLLAKDIMDMRNYTNVPNSSLIELIKLNKQMYPAAFIK